MGAFLSDDRLYRYALWRIWDESLPRVVFIMLNPSTADESVDDATIRRCIAFAKAWGYGGIIVVNLFAFRATEPKHMKAAADPVGPENDLYLRTVCSLPENSLTVCAWGAHGTFQNRANTVCTMLNEIGVKLHYFRLTGKGEPMHPLYQPGDSKPIEWTKEKETSNELEHAEP